MHVGVFLFLNFFPTVQIRKEVNIARMDEEKGQTEESGKEKVVNVALMEREDMPREELQTELVSFSFVF